jgi:hypothetical protein
MSTRMQQRRGTSDQWTAANPVLGEGEIGWESETNSFKIGDGVNNWTTLSYFQDAAALATALTDYYTSSQVDSEISTAVAGIIDSAPGALDTLNELAAAIGDNADFITSIGTDVTNAETNAVATAATYTDGRETAITTAYQTYADTAETDAVATAGTYTDGRETAITSAYQAYADTAEADAVSTANTYSDGLATNYDAAGSAATAQSNANTNTDSLIGDATVNGTTGNTVTDRIASAVSALVDSAPDALNTLSEIASALNDDANVYTTLTSYVDSAVAGAQPTFTNNFMLMGA